MPMRLILVGGSGQGKSSTGNTILGENRFLSDSGLIAVTTFCQLERNEAMGLTIVDTPSLFDTDSSFMKRALEIQRSVEICPKPHAFLLIFRMDCLNGEEKFTIKKMEIIFGKEVFNHCIVTFTGGCKNCKNFISMDHGSDEYKDGDEHPLHDDELRLYWRKNKNLSELVERCNGRVLRIENNKMQRCHIHSGSDMVKHIIDKVNLVSNNCKKVYSNCNLDIHKRVLTKNWSRPGDNSEVIDAILNQVEESLSNKEVGEMFITACKAVAVIAVVGLIASMICEDDKTDINPSRNTYHCKFKYKSRHRLL